VRFRPVPHLPFEHQGQTRPNVLRFGLEHESVVLELSGTGPRSGTLVPLTLATHLEPPELPPFAQLLLDILTRNSTLSIRADEAEESWRVVTPSNHYTTRRILFGGVDWHRPPDRSRRGRTRLERASRPPARQHYRRLVRRCGLFLFRRPLLAFQGRTRRQRGIAQRSRQSAGIRERRRAMMTQALSSGDTALVTGASGGPVQRYQR
jgi:Glucose-6-phosphate dehydrogenase, C-terminal domain